MKKDKPEFKKSFPKAKNRPYGKKEFSKKEDDGLTRLNKYIANSGICSRRDADELIKTGLISVNGKIITELGTKILVGKDEVRYNGERIRNEKKVYIVMNKPKDFITTMRDERNRKTVVDLIGRAVKERIFPVGRLDRNTTGVLLLTNDGDLAKKITHPKHNKKKIYHVELNKNLKPADMQTIQNGIELEDGFIRPDEISFVNNSDKTQLGLVIHSGQNRVVRRIFKHVGYDVVKLDRVYYAGLTKKDLPRGKWRFLTEKEISMLKMNAYE